MAKHNGIISLWKFIFSIVIAFYHSQTFYLNKAGALFKWGYIAVEFYFIINGFYFAKKVFKEKYTKKTIGKETLSFMISKIKTFFMPLLIIYIIHLLGIIIGCQYSVSQTLDTIWNFLLLRNFGVGNIIIFWQMWYLSIMLVSLTILYPLVKKYKENFVYLVCPTFIILGLGFLYHNYGTLNVANQYWFYGFNPSIIRGLLDISIGMLLFIAHEKLKKVEYTKFFRIFITILGETLLLGILFLVQFIKNANRYDFIMLFILSFAILIITSEKTYDYKILSNKFVYYLEKLSLYVFINHITVYLYLNLLYNGTNPLYKSILGVTMTIILSILEERIFAFMKTKNCNLGKCILDRIILKEEGKKV